MNLVIFLVSWVVGFAAINAVTIRLKKKHSKEWMELGEPGLFFNNTISSGLKLMGFLIMLRFRSLKDPVLSAISTVAFLSLAMLACSILVILISDSAY